MFCEHRIFLSLSEFYCAFIPISGMSRSSYPDFSSIGSGEDDNTKSWVKMYNEVAKDPKGGSKTISIGSMRPKPGVNGLFSVLPERHSDMTFPDTLKDRVIICNGRNIMALTYDDVMGMTRSEAHETLFQLRVEGYLMKKGFKRLRMWKNRFFVLSGMILNYYEVGICN